MTKPFTLLQISDCHLLADPKGRYRGQSPDECLQRLSPAMAAFKPDGLVLTGDVAEDGSSEAYERAIDALIGLAPKRAVIPGNHDDPDHMFDIFDAAGFAQRQVVTWGGWAVALLDSVQPNDPAGALSPTEYQLLEDAQTLALPTLVFLHHPPMAVGSPWIDRYALNAPEPFIEAVGLGQVQAVGFGHVHQVFSEHRGGVQYLSAPATSVNSQPDRDSFTPDPTGPKARWYRLWPNGRWASGVISAG